MATSTPAGAHALTACAPRLACQMASQALPPACDTLAPRHVGYAAKWPLPRPRSRASQSSSVTVRLVRRPPLWTSGTIAVTLSAVR